METKASPSSSSSCFCLSSYVSSEKLIEICSSIVSAATYALFYAVFTFFFAIGGATLGTLMGVLIGLKTCTSILFGAIFGGIKGGLLSTVVFKLSVSPWHFDDSESAISSSRHFIDAAANILGRRFDHELLSMIMPSSLENQEDSAGTIFDVVPGDYSEEIWITVDKIQSKTITDKHIKDASMHKTSCSVCLQDIQVGEMARSSPKCLHMFHSSCIGKWLTKHRSCPLCRGPF